MKPESKVKVAGEAGGDDDLMKVGHSSAFHQAIAELFREIRPRRIIETGTYLGEGTTRIVAETLLELGLADADFVSIEVNPRHYEEACRNVERRGLPVRLLHGLSIPRALLPTPADIQKACVDEIGFEGIFVDHAERDRVRLYHEETDFTGAKDDLLGECLAAFDHAPDFLLLDSAGHVGNIEFNYVLPLIRRPCHIALDDVFHIKHFRSYQQMKEDPRFAVRVVSEEKFGFCIARFTPGGER